MGKRERRLTWLLLIVILFDIFYYAHAGYIALTVPSPAHGGRYREGILGQPRLINPLVGTSTADQSLIHLVYSGLYRYDSQGNIVPDLAREMPQISDDQKQYTIYMREDAQWHNGKKVTADDVVFTIHMLQNAEFNSPLRGFWLNTTVEKSGDYTVIFGNKDISAPFIHNLTLPILPAEIWANVSAGQFLLSSLNLEAVGSGPYIVREIKKLPSGKIQSIRLESFSNYYGGKPYIDTISTLFYDTYEDLVSALHAKAIDGFGYVSLDTTLTLNTERNDINLYRLPLPQYQGAFFNLKHPILSDKTVRTALSLATDRGAILEEVFADSGLALAGPILPEQLKQPRDITLSRPDAAQASQLLDQAGWLVNLEGNMRSKRGAPLEFTITTNDFPLNAKAAELLAMQWRAIGVNAKLNVVSTKDLTGQLLPSRGFDCLVFAVKLSADPDPFVLWHSSQSKDPGLNITQFNIAEADKLISEGRSTTDANIRTEKYKRFQEIISAETPAIFLNQTVFVYAMHTNVKGMDLQSIYDPAYRFYDSPNWYIEEKRVWD